MYLCYIDESGTPDIPGNTSHFILAGLAIPIWHWHDCERDINNVKSTYALNDEEIHTAWIARKYPEQNKIPNFNTLNHRDRRFAVNKLRTTELLRLQRAGKQSQYKQQKKNYAKTEMYIHLTYNERIQFLEEIAQCVRNWGFARLFAECIDKIHFNPYISPKSVDEQAFEQIVSRFEQYLAREPHRTHGILVHDNNETVAKKHTHMMKGFHQNGTFWTRINHTIETPFFVDSQLTSMVQIADLCAYAIRRYLENNETNLFNHIFTRAHRIGSTTVGVRHFTNTTVCSCGICSSHTYQTTVHP